MKEDKDFQSASSLNITVIGAGTWGTTLSVMLAEKGYKVCLGARDEKISSEISALHTSKKYTFDYMLPKNLKSLPFSSKSELFSNPEIIIFAVPSHALRDILRYFLKELEIAAEGVKAIVNVAKGLETETNMRLSEVIRETLPETFKNKIAVMSGPNIASEVLEKLPGVSVISSENQELLKYLQPIFTTDYFRIYTNNDILGVEISAAVKNIIAIAAGISDGLGYGCNSKASLITRGLYELSKIGVAIGANPRTFSGVAGMGDLITTCISAKSRNRMVGERLAGGETIDEIIKSMYMVAEGINTTRAIYEISKEKNIDIPITTAVYDILYRGAHPFDSVKFLMSRKFKSED